MGRNLFFYWFIFLAREFMHSLGTWHGEFVGLVPFFLLAVVRGLWARKGRQRIGDLETSKSI